MLGRDAGPATAREWERAVLFGLVEAPSRRSLAIAALKRFGLAIPIALLTMLGAPAAAALANTYFVSNANDSGLGSLRAAITMANSHAGADTITVAPGVGTLTIQPQTPLNSFTGPVLLNGGGLITLNDTLTTGNGLVLAAGSSGSTLEGITVEGAGVGTAVVVGASGEEIVHNFFTFAGREHGRQGILIRSSNNTVGANIVNGASLAGILIQPPSGSSATGNLIQGNTIGTDSGGDGGLGNLGGGVLLLGNSTGNTIGGSGAAGRNVISGNGHYGVLFTGGGENTAQGNEIGTTPSASASLPNQWGVGIDGGAVNDTVTLNTISGNTYGGVLLGGGATSGNELLGNLIGTNSQGTALGNGGDGVLINGGATLNTIGGTQTSQGNHVGFNLGGGVIVSGSTTTRDALLSNLIFSSGPNRSGPGIKLVASANGGVHPPVINSITTSGSVGTTITGTGVPSATIQTFRNGSCSDPEGKTLLGTTHADASTGSWSMIVPAVQKGRGVTAAQTTPNSDSSPFSACFSAP